MDTNQGMTIKEIAEIANVSESTIRNWITLAGIARPSAEIAQATNEPFRFDLVDVIAIIRAGGRGTLADLLVENARQARDISKDAPENPIVLELIGIIKSQAAVIENLTGEIQTLRRLDKSRAVALLPDRSDGTEEWINTTRLSLLYGKSRATCLSHARAMGWPMRVSRLDTGSLTYEFLLSGLPEKIQSAWREHNEMRLDRPGFPLELPEKGAGHE
jgi:hypothetical protein